MRLCTCRLYGQCQYRYTEYDGKPHIVAPFCCRGELVTSLRKATVTSLGPQAAVAENDFGVELDISLQHPNSTFTRRGAQASRRFRSSWPKCGASSTKERFCDSQSEGLFTIADCGNQVSNFLIARWLTETGGSYPPVTPAV